MVILWCQYRWFRIKINNGDHKIPVFSSSQLVHWCLLRKQEKGCWSEKVICQLTSTVVHLVELGLILTSCGACVIDFLVSLLSSCVPRYSEKNVLLRASQSTKRQYITIKPSPVYRRSAAVEIKIWKNKVIAMYDSRSPSGTSTQRVPWLWRHLSRYCLLLKLSSKQQG